MTRSVLLVRHPPVTLHWQKRCYGQSDPGLSREGMRIAASLAAKLESFAPDLIIHSDMRRTRTVAEMLARSTAVPIHADQRWRERNFGTWEGHNWQAIYRRTGNAMDSMLTDPDGFRPGGGETTSELLNRSWEGWLALPPVSRAIVVAHGGPIAAILARREGAPPIALPRFMPTAGSITAVNLP